MPADNRLPQAPEPPKPSYEELEAQAAAMRSALEDVWSVCSKDHWRQVGEALEPAAGKRLNEALNKTRYERDILCRPARHLAEILNGHDRKVLLCRSFHDRIRDEDEDCIELELKLGVLREARDALQAVEATPETIYRLKSALQEIEGYSKFHSDLEDLEEAGAELRALTTDVPRIARRALDFSNLPERPGIIVDETLAKARRYEQALREIAARAEEFTKTEPAREISHALKVELPDDANRALCPEDSLTDPSSRNFDPDLDLPF